MIAALLRLAGPFGMWLLCWAVAIALLPVAAVIALKDMAVEAWRKRRDRRIGERGTAGAALRGGEK